MRNKQPWRLVTEILICFIAIEALRLVSMLATGAVPLLVDYLESTEENRFQEIASYPDAIIVAPLLETCVIAIVVSVLFKVTHNVVLICASVASIAAVAHLHAGLSTTISAITSFFVLAIFYIRWLRIAGRAKGFIAALVPHMLANSLAVVTIALGAS